MNIHEAWTLGDVCNTPLVGTRENVDRFIRIDRILDQHCRDNFMKALEALKRCLRDPVCPFCGRDNTLDLAESCTSDDCPGVQLIEELEEVDI